MYPSLSLDNPIRYELTEKLPPIKEALTAAIDDYVNRVNEVMRPKQANHKKIVDLITKIASSLWEGSKVLFGARPKPS